MARPSPESTSALRMLADACDQIVQEPVELAVSCVLPCGAVIDRPPPVSFLVLCRPSSSVRADGVGVCGAGRAASRAGARPSGSRTSSASRSPAAARPRARGRGRPGAVPVRSVPSAAARGWPAGPGVAARCRTGPAGGLRRRARPRARRLGRPWSAGRVTGAASGAAPRAGTVGAGGAGASRRGPAPASSVPGGVPASGRGRGSRGAARRRTAGRAARSGRASGARASARQAPRLGRGSLRRVPPVRPARRAAGCAVADGGQAAAAERRAGRGPAVRAAAGPRLDRVAGRCRRRSR